MNKETLELEIQEIMSTLDDARLQTLVSNLSDAEVQHHKTELTDAWLLIFEMRYYNDLHYKINTKDEHDPYFTYLLHLLREAEKINPPTLYHEERSRCYQFLAGLTPMQEKKLAHIETAAKEITHALAKEPSSTKLNDRMINIFLERARIRNQSHFTGPEFAELLGYFEQVLTRFSEEEWTSLLRYSLEILDFTSRQNRYWHITFMDKLAAAIQTFATTDRPAYLAWAERQQRLINFWLGVTSEKYKIDVVKQLGKLLPTK